jgi:hypothetical protein
MSIRETLSFDFIVTQLPLYDSSILDLSKHLTGMNRIQSLGFKKIFGDIWY